MGIPWGFAAKMGIRGGCARCDFGGGKWGFPGDSLRKWGFVAVALGALDNGKCVSVVLCLVHHPWSLLWFPVSFFSNHACSVLPLVFRLRRATLGISVAACYHWRGATLGA